jgi:hypothetical protein
MSNMNQHKIPVNAYLQRVLLPRVTFHAFPKKRIAKDSATPSLAMLHHRPA